MYMFTNRGMTRIGSLCAERNAIGSALANDPTLLRSSLKMIGVLGVNLNEEPKGPQPTEKPDAPSFFIGPPTLLEEQYQQSPMKKAKRPRTFSCDAHTLDDAMPTTT